MKRNVLNSPRLLELKKRKRRVFIRKFLLCLFAFLAVLALLVYISRITIFNISSVEITGNKLIETETIKTVVEKEITGNYFWFFPKTNIALYPQNNIKNRLHDEFKRLKDINFSIESDGNSKILAVSLSEREALYTWCGENLPEVEIKLEEYSCYFMDDGGYVFDQAPHFSGEVYFRFWGPLAGFYFSTDVFGKVVAFKDFLLNMAIKPTSVYLKKDGDVEIYLSANILPPNAPKIIFKKDFNLEKLSENLQAALNTEPLQSNFKNKYSSLLYVDLRYGNKVYYKFR